MLLLSLAKSTSIELEWSSSLPLAMVNHKNVKKFAAVRWVVEYFVGLRCQLQLVNIHETYLEDMYSEFQSLIRWFCCSNERKMHRLNSVNVVFQFWASQRNSVAPQALAWDPNLLTWIFRESNIVSNTHIRFVISLI